MRPSVAFILLAAPFVLAVPTAASAQNAAPKSIEDCESIKADLAYNACLAEFGPKVGERTARVALPSDEVEDEPAVKSTRGTKGKQVRNRGGRKTASFDVVTGSSRSTKAKAGRRPSRR